MEFVEKTTNRWGICQQFSCRKSLRHGKLREAVNGPPAAGAGDAPDGLPPAR
jgi:hypothetical protein